MRGTMSKSFFAPLLGLSVLSFVFFEQAVGDDGVNYDLALQAYLNGEYISALQAFLPLAEHGTDIISDYSQLKIGEMYETGKGVEVDPVKAYFWYHLVAGEAYKSEREEQASKVKDDNIPVEHDIFIEYAWYARELLARKMTAAQINEAKELARQWNKNRQH